MIQTIFVAVTVLQISLSCDTPNIIDDDLLLDVNELQTTTLTWEGQGFDNVTWTFIPTGSDIIYPYPFPLLGAVRLANFGRTLIIEKTPFAADGVFISVAMCTSTGKTDSINMTLMVHDCFPPTYTISDTSNVSVSIGETARLHCVVNFQCIREVLVAVTWLWNGTLADSNRGMFVSTNISGTEYATTLTIQEVMENHFRRPFICAVDITYEQTEKEIFLIKKVEKEVVYIFSLTSLILGASIPLVLLILFSIAAFVFWPCMKWKMLQFLYSFCFRTRKENEKRRYDVLLYHNDDGKKEAEQILEFLLQNDYNVLSEIKPGQAYSSMRDMIEDSASVIIIATSDKIVSSVLTETTEEIRTPILIILTKLEQNFSSPIVNNVKLRYPYETFTCFSMRKTRFYMEIKANLPFPRVSSIMNGFKNDLEGSSIPMLENASVEKNTDNQCGDNSEKLDCVV